MKKQIFLLICVLLFDTAQAQIQNWFEYSDWDDSPSQLIQTNDGSYVFGLGRSVAKVDQNGELLWESTTDYFTEIFPPYTSIILKSLAELDDGNFQTLYYVRQSDGNYSTLLVNLSANGDYINHFLTDESIEIDWEVLRDENGDYYFLTYFGERDVVKLNDHLELQWKVSIPEIQTSYGGERFYINDGILTFMVFGGSWTNNGAGWGYLDLFRYKIDSNTGSILEETFLREMEQYATYLLQPSDGSYYLISGGFSSTSSSTVTVFRYDSSDELIAEGVTNIAGASPYPGSSSVSPNSIIMLPNGNIAMTASWFYVYVVPGDDVGSSISSDWFVLLDKEGQMIESERIQDLYGFGSSTLLALNNNQIMVGGKKDGDTAFMIRDTPGCNCPTEINPVCGPDGTVYDNACLAECEGVVFEDCNDGCDCPTEISPVCGPDGTVYDNACLAECEGVVFEDCNDGCDCPTEINPVCGPDGTVYDNACLAECEGITVGDCPDSIDISEYPWLTDLVQLPLSDVCDVYTKIIEYQYDVHTFIFVEGGPNGSSMLYNVQGDLYCTNLGDLDCVAAYGLTNGTVLWSCNSEIECICTTEYDPVCGSNGVEYSNACVAACEGVTWTAGPCDNNNNNNNNNNTPYVWLNDMLDAEDCCSTNRVTRYQFGSYAFIFVFSDESGDCGYGTLYDGEGQLYCTSFEGFNCLALYDLSDGEELWSCNDDESCICTTEYDPVCGSDGVEYSNACEAACQGVTWTAGTCYSGSNVPTTSYDWLNELLTEQDCCTANKAILYQTGVHYYVYIAADESGDCGIGTLYNEEGLFYCNVTNTFDCVALYGLTEVSILWTCTDDSPVYNFEDYPWLEDLVDQNDCCSANEIYEYTDGINSFIYVVPESSCEIYPMMYNSAGQFYCQSGDGFDCLALYNITDWEANLLYECTNTDRIGVENLNENVQDISVYPNPSSGLFNLEYLNNFDENNTIMHVYDNSGKLILEQSAEGVNTIDLSDFSAGMYMLRLTNYQGTIMKKIIVK